MGTEVQVTLPGLVATGVTLAELGGVAAPIVNRAGETVTITVPANAKSGPVTLHSGADVRTTPVSFEVTRVVTASVGAGFPGVTTVGSFFGNATGGQIQVAVGRANLVFASSAGNGPPLLAIVTDADAGVTLNANSTAVATMFLSTLVFTADSAEAGPRIQKLASLPELGPLASYIQGEVQAGRDYGETIAFEQHLETALSAYVASVYAEPAPAEPAVTALQAASAEGYVARDLKVPGYELLDRIQPTTHTSALDPRTGLPVVRQKFGSAPIPDAVLGKYLSGNPLEWVANLYALDISDGRINTKTEAEALQGSHSAVYWRNTPEALDRLVIGSEPYTRYVDLAGVLKSWIGKKVTGFVGSATDTATKSELIIPDDAAGLYMVRAFNGARFPLQDTLIDNLPGGRREDRVMLTMNIVLAVNDAVSFLLSAKDVFSDNAWAAFLSKLEFSIAGALDAQAAQGTLDGAAIRAIFLASVKTAYDWAWDRLKSAGISALPSRLGSVVKSVLNVTGKVASVAKLVERINALSNAVQVFGDNVYTIQSVEDTLITVGNPWAPHISGFSPQRAQRGSLVTITGDGFSSTPSQNTVTIGYLGTSPESPPVPAQAEVVEAYNNSLVIRIPEDANTGVIRVSVPGRGTGSTLSLDPPFQQFEVIPDPVLTAVVPGTIHPGRAVRLVGQNFPPLGTEGIFSITDGLFAVFDLNGETYRSIISGTSNEFVTLAPFLTGTGTVRILFGERSSNPLPVTVAPLALPKTGAELRVSTGADGNVRDGQLTLREALMLVAGTLDYASLTAPPSPRPSGTTYERDYVSSDMVGPAVRNQIVRLLSVTNITLTAPLPAVPSWKQIYFFDNLGNGTRTLIDGAGAATGFLLNNSSNVQIRGVKFTGFSEAAIKITGGSADNLIDYSQITGGTGHGVELLDSAERNAIYVPVRNVGGDGYRLSGANVRMNDIQIVEKPSDANGSIEGCGGWGVRISDGAQFNRVMAPAQGLFGQPVPGGILSNASGGILIIGETSIGNAIHPMYGPGLHIDGNGGPGIRIESPSSTVYLCHLGNNTGEGIVIIGTNAANSKVSGCNIGFNAQTGAPMPNGGHGLRLTNTRHVQVGEDFRDLFTDLPFNRIAANGGQGILIENSHDIILRSTELGRVHLSDQSGSAVDLPNAMSGIVVQNSHDCIIGSSWWLARVQVTGHTNGTGIRLTGTQTHDNTVIGTYVGCEYFPGFNTMVGSTDLGNQTGIELIEGAWGNRIGMRGRGLSGTGASPMNYVYFNRTAGIVVDSGLDPAQTIPTGGEPIAPKGGNLVVNNSVQKQYETGILLKSGAKAAQIGGVWWEFNVINDNKKFGIRIENASASRPELGNRVIGNGLSGNGRLLANPPDPLTGQPEGVGIMLDHSSGQRIGGDRVAEGNGVWNSWVGIMDLNGTNNFIAGNNLDTHRKAGIILRDSWDSQVGPDNDIALSGNATNTPIGAIALSGGGNHLVIGNRVGSWRNGNASTVTPDALLLKDTAGNQVGGLGPEGNVLVNATGYGLRITGAGSTQNEVAGNWIGSNPGPGAAVQPNLTGGIVLESGASMNVIGGTLPVNVNGAVAQLAAGNSIQHNGGEGVRVSGVPTLSNTILNNSVTDNSGLGIFLGSGNRSLPAPALTAAPGVINGTSIAPNGSIVQLFNDAGGEGEILLGEAVVVGGMFQFPIPPLITANKMTATVTDAATGDTSQFASPVTIIPPTPLGLHVSRVGTALPRSGAPGAAVITLPLKLNVTGQENVRVTRLMFGFSGIGSGSSTGALSAASLFVDANTNGVIDPGEPSVGGVVTNFTSGAQFSGPLVVVEPGRESRLLLQALLSSNAVPGAQFNFTLTNATAVTASAVLGPTPVSVSGDFAVVSDLVSVGTNSAPANYAAWSNLYFSPAELTGIGVPGGDPENDRLSNLMEYFLGTDPRNVDPYPFRITRQGATGMLVFTNWNRSDLTWTITESSGLGPWNPLSAATLMPAEALGDGRFRQTVTFDLGYPGLFLRLRVEAPAP